MKELFSHACDTWKVFPETWIFYSSLLAQLC